MDIDVKWYGNTAPLATLSDVAESLSLTELRRRLHMTRPDIEAFLFTYRGITIHREFEEVFQARHFDGTLLLRHAQAPVEPDDDLKRQAEEVLSRLETEISPQLQAIKSASGMVRALYDFTKEEERYLVFHKNQVLRVINRDSKKWWYAEDQSNGKKGYIPSNYVIDLSVEEASDRPAIQFDMPQQMARPPKSALHAYGDRTPPQ